VGSVDDGAIIAPTAVTPKLQGAASSPDVIMSVSLETFHLAASERVDNSSTAAMRIHLGPKQETTREALLGNLFWTIVSGLQLYNEQKQRKAKPKEFETPMSNAFAQRLPIQIPGGIMEFSFQVVRPRDRAWYEILLDWLTGKEGAVVTNLLSAAVGFPGVVPAALGIIDRFVDGLVGDDADVLFSGEGLRYAITAAGRSELAADDPSSQIGCLNPGRWVLVRGRDLPLLVQNKARYWHPYGVLAPYDKTDQDVASGNYQDPFAEVPYAVLRIRMTEIDLTKTMLGVRPA
jgi:hypothetical protein